MCVGEVVVVVCMILVFHFIIVLSMHKTKISLSNIQLNNKEFRDWAWNLRDSRAQEKKTVWYAERNNTAEASSRLAG